MTYLDRRDVITLAPTGVGEPRTLPAGPLRERSQPVWLPDGKRILFAGLEPGRRRRLSLQDLDGLPQPIASEAITLVSGSPISHDGRFVAALLPDGIWALVPLAGGEPRPIAGVEAGERVARFAADGSLYVFTTNGLPSRITRLDPVTGRREPVRDIAPPSAEIVGVRGISRVFLTPDAGAYAYTLNTIVSDLYLVEMLR